MKIAIRRGVFETNSSSTHSVSIIGKNKANDHTLVTEDLPELKELKVDERYDKVISSFGQFGWGPECFNDISIKLSYALTMVAETECHSISSSMEFFESEGFKMINDAIANRYHCKGVFVDSDINIERYKNNDGTEETYIDIDGYIDHQSSRDSYRSLEEFLDENCVDIDTFLFDKEVVIFILNDNSYNDTHDKYLKKHINITSDFYDDDEEEEDTEDEIEAEEDY